MTETILTRIRSARPRAWSGPGAGAAPIGGLNPLIMIGALILLGWTLLAASWPLWLRDPLAADAMNRLAAPSAEYWFGTDSLGRDVFARVIAGSTSALGVGFAAAGLAMIIGVAFGATAAYRGGWADELIMRGADILLAFPGLVIAIVVLGLVRSGSATLIIVLAILFAPLAARSTRGAVLAIKDQEYVEAARLRGESVAYILGRELLPNVASTLVVEGTVRLSSSVITATSLSFLGLGIKPPSPNWGATIATEANFITIAWWSPLFPALALASLVIGVALFAEGINARNDR